MEEEGQIECTVSTHINDLPNEILEYILSLLLPYEDLEQCQVVCKRWKTVVQNVVKHKKLEFLRAVCNFRIQWEDEDNDSNPIITKRYFHSACSHENAMYVFGGCACASTTFNDLWKLDLSTRKWSRLLTMGSYPCPKACATLVYFNNSLILFGGWTYPSPYPLHQPWTIFNELHIYDIAENKWNAVTFTNPPPAMAGHTATIHGDTMVVIGGQDGAFSISNDVWCLNLKTMVWSKKETTENKPQARFKHSQIAIDAEHLIILGGYTGPPNMMVNDIWMLTMTGKIWTWTLLAVSNPQWAASHVWCHQACKVNENYVVVLSRNPDSTPTSLAYTSWAISTAARSHNRRPFEEHIMNVERNAIVLNARGNFDRDINVNGRRGCLAPRVVGNNRVPPNAANVPRRGSEPPPRLMPAMNAYRCSTNPKNREKRLDVLRKMEEKIRQVKKDTKKPKQKSKMAMFVLDISRILEEKHEVNWLPLKQVADGSPEATIFYTLVKGKGELIMFGGIKKNPSIVQWNQHKEDDGDTVSNSLHFITAPVTPV